MKAYGGVDVWIHIFFTFALVGGEWSASLPCRFTLGERAPGTHWIGVGQTGSGVHPTSVDLDIHSPVRLHV
jgi:hypothetical protein